MDYADACGKQIGEVFNQIMSLESIQSHIKNQLVFTMMAMLSFGVAVVALVQGPSLWVWVVSWVGFSSGLFLIYKLIREFVATVTMIGLFIAALQRHDRI